MRNKEVIQSGQYSDKYWRNNDNWFNNIGRKYGHDCCFQPFRRCEKGVPSLWRTGIIALSPWICRKKSWKRGGITESNPFIGKRDKAERWNQYSSCCKEVCEKLYWWCFCRSCERSTVQGDWSMDCYVMQRKLSCYLKFCCNRNARFLRCGTK